MSDPMTKVEIEDVLSSIRRLVSEDLKVPQAGGPAAARIAVQTRPMPFVAPAPSHSAPPAEQRNGGDAEEALDSSFFDPNPDVPAAEAGLPEGALSASAEDSLPDPLMLTPALRVAEAESASLRASLEDTIAELEAAISGSGDEWEPDGGEMPDGALDFGKLSSAMGATDTDAAEPEAESHEPVAPMTEPSLAEMADEPAVAKSPIRLVSDYGDERPEGLWSQYPETMEWAAPGDLDEGEAGIPAEGEGLTDAWEATDGLDLAPEARGALPGEAVADADADQAERFWAAEAEDAADADELVPVDEIGAAPSAAPEWQDDPSADAKPRRLHLAGGLGWGATPPISAAGRAWSHDEPDADDILEAEEDDDDTFVEVEDAIIDEAALRALVSEIIRQELQGTLGERITRSVRKLVRREIQRALAARDFE